MVPTQHLGIDVADWIVAACTAALVVLNGLLVYFNGRLFEVAKSAADAALQQGKTAQRLLEIAHQPALRPVDWRAEFLARNTVLVRCDIKNMRDVPTEVTKLHVRAWGDGPLPRLESYDHPYLDNGVVLFEGELLEDVRARVHLEDPERCMIVMEVMITYWNRAASREEERVFSVGALLAGTGHFEFTERPPQPGRSDREGEEGTGGEDELPGSILGLS